MHAIATPEAPFNVTTHNGRITIKSPSGEHRTVKISTQPADAKFAPGERIVSLLVGPDNESSYQTFGFVNRAGVYLFKKHQNSKFYLWLARFLDHPEKFTDKVDILFEGTCRKCNRTLTTPESILSGIGPVCAGKE